MARNPENVLLDCIKLVHRLSTTLQQFVCIFVCVFVGVHVFLMSDRNIAVHHQKTVKALKINENPEAQNYQGLPDLVPVAGVEPARCRHHRILNPARLPIPSHRHATQVLYTLRPTKSRVGFAPRRLLRFRAVPVIAVSVRYPAYPRGCGAPPIRRRRSRHSAAPSRPARCGGRAPPRCRPYAGRGRCPGTDGDGRGSRRSR